MAAGVESYSCFQTAWLGKLSQYFHKRVNKQSEVNKDSPAPNSSQVFYVAYDIRQSLNVFIFSALPFGA